MKRLLFLLAFVAGLSGCATPTPMAFQNDSEKAAEKRNPVFLITATLKNTYRTSYQPKLLVVNVEKPDAKEKADRLNFTMDDKSRDESDVASKGNTYLLRLELEPGQYKLLGLSSVSRSFPVNGFFFTPILASLEAKGSGIFYLGHIHATVRERQGNEFRAGPPIPLIDQAVTGASGGTFDVEIVDAWSTDEQAFLARFPALRGAEGKKALLPAFNRAAAQQWWESN